MNRCFPSRYNLVTQIDENSYAIFNPLSGAFDIADSKEKEAFESGVAQDSTQEEYWLERGYYFKDASSEQQYVNKRYFDFFDVSNENQIQFMLVLTYGCNFNCEYCYQRGVDTSKNVMSVDMLDAFIDFVIDYRNKHKKDVIVSLFGGEPLLPGKKHQELISHLIARLSLEKIPLTVVTNGYNLEEYIPLLSNADIKEIHVSLDGDRDEHDRRRQTKDGKDSFNKILNGMHAAKDAGFPINVRLITDKKTMSTLPGLAERLEEEGFFDLPKGRFKTSLGRNYELINEYVKPEDLFDLDQMYSAYVKLMLEFPILEKLHMPSFFGVTKVAKEGEMYVPSFDTCPAGKSEFVFDSSGSIFGCTASCGRDGYELGSFYPEVKWNNEELRAWKSRNILNIEECKECSVGVICGGGCGVIAKDREGKVHSPNCKPIKEVMDIGIQYYKDILLS